ncbi:MAG: hypothetical protein H0V51_15995 [Chloroflexi bacterium]|nr:hypothetical protein [Chloroflexota bacterium]
MAQLHRLGPLAFALLLGLLGADVARALPVPPGIADSPADYHGFLNGRFLLLNMHGALFHPGIEATREDVRYAAWMNAGVIRVFATDQSLEEPEDGERVGHRIADLAPTLREHRVKLIVALVNNHQEVPGERPESVGEKDGYWQLLLPFYTDTWRGAYLDFSRRLIHTVVDRGARDVIFAWELGNELHTPDDPPRVLTFIEDMAREIRRLDPETALLPGTMGTHHLEPWRLSAELGRRLYCEGPIAAYTLHGYDWLGPDRWGDMPIHWDFSQVIAPACSNGRKLPVIVEELGTSRELPNVWGAGDEERRFEQELHQLRMVLDHEQVVGIGSWSSESPLVSHRRFDDRRGLTSYGPARDGSGSCYPPGRAEPGVRCRLEQVLRSLPARP